MTPSPTPEPAATPHPAPLRFHAPHLHLAFSLQAAYAAPLILLAQTHQADAQHRKAQFADPPRG